MVGRRQSTNKIVQYRMTVHLFGACSSPSVACYALRKAVSDNEDVFSPEVIATLRSNFYVDDVLKSSRTEDDAVRLAQELNELCRMGGFNLTMFASYSPVVASSFQVEDRSKELKRWAGPWVASGRTDTGKDLGR